MATWLQQASPLLPAHKMAIPLRPTASQTQLRSPMQPAARSCNRLRSMAGTCTAAANTAAEAFSSGAIAAAAAEAATAAVGRNSGHSSRSTVTSSTGSSSSSSSCSTGSVSSSSTAAEAERTVTSVHKMDLRRCRSWAPGDQNRQ